MKYKENFCAFFVSLVPLWCILVPFNVYMCYSVVLIQTSSNSIKPAAYALRSEL